MMEGLVGERCHGISNIWNANGYFSGIVALRVRFRSIRK